MKEDIFARPGAEPGSPPAEPELQLDLAGLESEGEYLGREADTESVEAFVEAELGLDILTRFGNKSRGRRATKPPLYFEFVRDLEPEDALAWENAPVRKVGESGGIPSLQRVRTIHHQIARMLVSGTKIVHISATLGISPERIQQLKNDPTFIELQEHYREVEETAEISLKHRFMLLGTAGMEELQDRLLNEPDSFGNGHLMELIKLSVGGEAPKSSAESNKTRTLTQEDLAALKESANGRASSQIEYKKESAGGETSSNSGS